MKAKRTQHPKRAKPVPAQVISLAAYREAHRRPVPEAQAVRVAEVPPSLMDAYCQWLGLVGAAWAWWW
jgi:hypothetical protein